MSGARRDGAGRLATSPAMATVLLIANRSLIEGSIHGGDPRISPDR
jgi:hypothetical protein